MTRQQVREIDRRAIDEYGLPGIVLMENAGRGTAELLIRLGIHRDVVICAGRGNNGGDGFVIARHLENHGHKVRVLVFVDPQALRGDAAINYRVLVAGGTPMQVFSGTPAEEELASALQGAGWIVDALLGTGMQGTVREPFATAIAAINSGGTSVLAVDLPSGLDCDIGEPLGCCVRADHTATFVAPKRGFDNPASRQWTGTVHVIDIGAPRLLLEGA